MILWSYPFTEFNLDYYTALSVLSNVVYFFSDSAIAKRVNRPVLDVLFVVPCYFPRRMHYDIR